MDEQHQSNLEQQAFIDKNAQRYCNIFEKNKDKKVFARTNWAAFFFGENWMFYRKMYLWGVIAMVLQYVLILAVVIALIAAYQPQLSALFDATVDEYVAAMSEGNFMMLFDGEMPASEARNAFDALLYGKILLPAIVVELLVRLVLSLFADCIYRAHVRKHIQYADGGVSTVAVIVAVVVSCVVSWIASDVVYPIIMQVFGIF